MFALNPAYATNRVKKKLDDEWSEKVDEEVEILVDSDKSTNAIATKMIDKVLSNTLEKISISESADLDLENIFKRLKDELTSSLTNELTEQQKSIEAETVSKDIPVVKESMGATLDPSVNVVNAFSSAIHKLLEHSERVSPARSGTDLRLGYGEPRAHESILKKSDKINVWEGVEKEPWENVEARVKRYAHTAGVLEYLLKDKSKDIKRCKSKEEKTYMESCNTEAFMILHAVFSKKGKAFRIMKAHLRAADDDMCGVEAHKVWMELCLRMKDDKKKDRSAIRTEYHGYEMGGMEDPDDMILKMEELRNDYEELGGAIDDSEFLLDVLSKLPATYSALQIELEEKIEDGEDEVTIEYIGKKLQRRYKQLTKQSRLRAAKSRATQESKRNISSKTTSAEGENTAK